jgi:hypothetical protein
MILGTFRRASARAGSWPFGNAGTGASLDKAAGASLDYAFPIRPRSLAKLAVN